MRARAADPPAGGAIAVSAAIAGNALEWFDFTVYSFFAVIIAKLFFPSNPDNPDDNINRILMTTAVFGVGFLPDKMIAPHEIGGEPQHVLRAQQRPHEARRLR